MTLRNLATMLALWLAACASAVPYTAQPGRIKDPQAEVLSLIAANPEPGCTSKAEFTGNVLSVKILCAGGDTASTATRTARLDRIGSMEIVKRMSQFLLIVHHSGGSFDFWWSASNVEDAERLEDAFAALSAAAPH